MDMTYKRAGMGDESGEVARLEKELAREHELYLRALADFDNYRRRVERERAVAAQAGKRDLILSLLDVLDNFDLALAHITDAPAPMLEGVLAIRRKLLAALESHGVTAFESLGEQFDPALHEAIVAIETDEHEPDTVIEVLRRGYRWGDEVLRHAQVQVAR